MAGFHLNIFRGVKLFRRKKNKTTKNNKIKIVLRNTGSLHITLHFITLLLGKNSIKETSMHLCGWSRKNSADAVKKIIAKRLEKFLRIIIEHKSHIIPVLFHVVILSSYITLLFWMSGNARPTFQNNCFWFITFKGFNLKTRSGYVFKELWLLPRQRLTFLNCYACKNGFSETVFVEQLYEPCTSNGWVVPECPGRAQAEPGVPVLCSLNSPSGKSGWQSCRSLQVRAGLFWVPMGNFMCSISCFSEFREPKISSMPSE